MEYANDVPIDIDEILEQLQDTPIFSSFTRPLSPVPSASNQFIDDDERKRYLVDRLTEVRKRRYVLHDIVTFGGHHNLDRVADQILHRFEHQGFTGRLLWLSWHFADGWDHLHVLHDCAFSARWCRCSIFNGITFKRRTSANFRLSDECSTEWWTNITKYFNKPPRQNLLFFVADDCWRSLRSHEINTMFGTPGSDDRVDTILDACNKGPEVHRPSDSSESPSGPHSPTSSSGGTRSCSTPRRQGGSKKQKIIQFFFKHPTSPILSIVKTKQWLDSEFAYIGRANDMFKQACDVFCRQICNYSIERFAELYLHSTPLFGAISGILDEEYYSRDESNIRLEELLLFQFHDTDRICDFLKIIYAHLNRQSGKKNCVQLTGPPSSGKTYFVNILSSFCLSKGQIRNFNKFDTFPLNDCVDKRILLWDEPNYERGALEQIKLLFSGDKCPANVKYENQVQIDRTPIYVTCNTDIFPNNDEFNCRMYKFDWQTLPNRNIVVKQIYPIAIYDLFVKYGIITKQ